MVKNNLHDAGLNFPPCICTSQALWLQTLSSPVLYWVPLCCELLAAGNDLLPWFTCLLWADAHPAVLETLLLAWVTKWDMPCPTQWHCSSTGIDYMWAPSGRQRLAPLSARGEELSSRLSSVLCSGEAAGGRSSHARSVAGFLSWALPPFSSEMQPCKGNPSNNFLKNFFKTFFFVVLFFFVCLNHTWQVVSSQIRVCLSKQMKPDLLVHLSFVCCVFFIWYVLTLIFLRKEKS